eukprot:CAMPEP_0171095134 /NCGR_PEP_ID=MMETSP0766_2-20121228/43002_1 /TAXON_ID=439317 /ORGANISM="Gambierdiscus australes, Strain CAWD 149" /LENGTH=693 /DNA_ID=CAMNT_0011553913 /DNA_START=36 /DNA_END=2117 /DNA_ORIENTATION=+
MAAFVGLASPAALISTSVPVTLAPGSIAWHRRGAPASSPSVPAQVLVGTSTVSIPTARLERASAVALCFCGLAITRLVQRRRRHAALVTSSAGPSTRVAVATAPMMPVNRSLDDVESTVAEFVPKISALQSQAELLRSGELKDVIDTMKALRKTELRGVFSEVDQLLAALIDAINGLRESALTIRKSELRQQFEQMDRAAQKWVGKVEKDAVETLTGFRFRAEEKVETMMEVHVVGLSHHSAPVEIREKLAVAQQEWNAYAQDLVQFSRTDQGHIVPEIAVLSTCNRFELYFASSEINRYAAVECVHAFLRQKSGLVREELEPHLFTYSGEAATNHLFEVSSGLDSLVLGEAQILAQVKACHEHCIQKLDPDAEGSMAGSGGKIIAKMLNAGIRMGKLVRTRTKIGKGSVSVSSAAVELMMARCLTDLRKYTSKVHVCIVGAGKMSRLLLIALFSKDPNVQLTLVNRSTDRAQALLDEVSNRGGANAKVAPADSMLDVIRSSDVVFTATGSKEPILKAVDLQDLQRRLMLVDISVPRNIAADCGDVENVVSYTVDDLKKVVATNAQKRQKEVLKAKNLITEEVAKFKVWQASQGAVPYLAALQAMAENIRRAETEKMARKLKGLHEKERQAVDKLTTHIVDQLFRPLYYSMKDDEDIEAKKNKIWALKEMFRLEPLYKRRLLSPGSARGQLNA